MNGNVNGNEGPKSPRQSKKSQVKGKLQVALLDDTVVAFDFESRSKGADLLKQVNGHLNMDEGEYFGLLYEDDEGNQCWLEPLKPINKQVKDPTAMTFQFRVMFYTPDPNSLQEYTRYLFTLQVRRDLLDGRLKCAEETGALLASYIVQGELGDYDESAHQPGYLTGFQFVPNQNAEVEEKIVDYHKSHKGETPSDADHNMLEIARQLDMYGITLYPAKDAESVDLDLAVYHLGILVFQHRHKINTFSWANVRKLSFKKKKFLIKLHKVGDSNYVVSFNMKSRNAAKGFWKICINHHVFFRQKSAVFQTKAKKSSLRRGSKYRYSGRTKKEIQETTSQRVRSPSEAGSEKQQHRSSLPNSSLRPLSPPSVSSSMQDSSYFGESSQRQFNKSISEDEGSYSLANTDSLRRKEGSISTNGYDSELALTPTLNESKHKIIKMRHQDTIDIKAEPYDEPTVESINVEPEESKPDFSFERTFDINKNSNEGDDLSLDATINVTSTDRELEDEVDSMFKKINSGWQYNISSITPETIDHSDTEDLNKSSECTEADADHYRNSYKFTSHKTEADEETEAQLKEKVKALYLQSCPVTQSYDSDSDASAMTVEEEESAFEDDNMSLPHSGTSSMSSIHKKENYAESRKSKTSGKVYFIAKEIFLTEKTYVKDLEVLTVSLRNALEREDLLNNRVVKMLFDNIDPLYDFHCSLLAELEERLNNWENGSITEASRDSVQKIGDIMHRNMRQMKKYTQYILKHENVMLALESETKKSKIFEEVYKEFELSKVCYLSLNSFLLKPVQRLFYYKDMLSRLSNEYKNKHSDAIDTKVAYEEVSEACNEVEQTATKLENLHKTIELQRDLVAIEDLVHPNRIFIREGCLHKICRKGPQPRMFFLFSDLLLYTSQGVTATSQFRARAQIPLHSMKVEEGGVELHGLYAFTISGPNSASFVVAANSPEEKQKWMEDIEKAVSVAMTRSVCSSCRTNKNELILQVGQDSSSMCSSCKKELQELAAKAPNERLAYWQSLHPPPPVIKRSTSDADSDDEGSYSLQEYYSSLDRRHAHARTISTRRVCWHRNASIGMKEYTLSLQNSISGDLLRRVKNSNKWQRLWVVFTNFCLYFFKNYDEESPVASLPLIGYTINKASESDSFEEYAFKLQFKTHVYFFRALTEYSYERWTEVLTIATKNSPLKQTRRVPAGIM